MVEVAINSERIDFKNKKKFLTEIYCKIALSFSHKSVIAKLRCGNASLRIETGRFENMRVDFVVVL